MKQSKIFTASLLVAGTAIGAGMLALPVSTAAGGFLPAVFIYLICWIFSACTGLLLLEACLWLPKDTNIVSLSSHLLGKKGKYASWILYLFLFYALTVAYAAGGGGFIGDVTNGIFPAPISILLFILVFSPVVYIGTHAVDRLNFLLMAGLIFFFSVFILIGFGKVELDLLGRFHWGHAILSLPVVFTSFSYQGIVPSMRNYFEGHPKAVRKVILIGSSIPVIVYIIWEYLILGIVPLEGANGLLAAKEQGISAVVPLKNIAGSPWVYAIGQAFAFCALTTSFLGVTLGLFDFFADGLKISKKGRSRIALYLLVYLPPTCIAMLFPKIFIKALSYAGGIGCVLLLGIIPVLMVWSGRYRKNLDRKHQQLGGGKWVLSLLALFVIFELIVEFISELL
ncbi:MAG: aromatic amino acid transport family protein [Simkaniaceae bacterium]|nr:aromatic amino acid transport family protein [Candidatus Sacchlamyda saccharinae]